MEERSRRDLVAVVVGTHVGGPKVHPRHVARQSHKPGWEEWRGVDYLARSALVVRVGLVDAIILVGDSGARVG